MSDHEESEAALPEDDAALEAKALEQLEAAAASGAAQAFLGFLDRRFHRAALDEQLYTEFIGAARTYFGREASAFLTRLAYADADDRPDEIEKASVNPETARFLTEFATLYATEVFRARSIWYRTRLGDDWMGSRRDVYRDVETGEYRVLVQITKGSGEIVRFEAAPGSILNLAASLARAALVVTDPAQFEEYEVNRFAMAAEQFESVFSESGSSDSSDEPQTDAPQSPS